MSSSDTKRCIQCGDLFARGSTESRQWAASRFCSEMCTGRHRSGLVGPPKYRVKSERDATAIRLAALGWSDEDIATELGIRSKTVRAVRHSDRVFHTLLTGEIYGGVPDVERFREGVRQVERYQAEMAPVVKASAPVVSRAMRGDL